MLDITAELHTVTAVDAGARLPAGVAELIGHGREFLVNADLSARDVVIQAAIHELDGVLGGCAPCVLAPHC